MLVRGVVDDELGDDPHAALVRFLDQPLDILQIAIGRIDRPIVGDVVAIVAQRRGIEGQKPDRRDAQLLDIVETRKKACEIADPVAIGVDEGLDMQLVDDRVLVPVRGVRIGSLGLLQLGGGDDLVHGVSLGSSDFSSAFDRGAGALIVRPVPG